MTMTTNRVTVGPNGYWICSCGEAMFYLAPPGNGPRHMQCNNPRCGHYRIDYVEPSFEVAETCSHA